MGHLRTSNPKLFYSKFARRKSSKNNVSIETFFDHFKELTSCNEHPTNVTEDNTRHDCVFDELDKDITESEIVKAIFLLKCEKRHGPDGILNECFIEFKGFSCLFL